MFEKRKLNFNKLDLDFSKRIYFEKHLCWSYSSLF